MAMPVMAMMMVGCVYDIGGVVVDGVDGFDCVGALMALMVLATCMAMAFSIVALLALLPMMRAMRRVRLEAMLGNAQCDDRHRACYEDCNYEAGEIRRQGRRG